MHCLYAVYYDEKGLVCGKDCAKHQLRRGWPPDIPLRATKGRPYKRGSGKYFPRVIMAVSAESKQRARVSQTKCRLAGGDMLA